MISTRSFAVGLAAAAVQTALAVSPALAEKVVNVYTSRHYDTDERLYTDFEKKTGIKVVRIEGKADALIARMKAEGKASPADVLITVDAGRIWRAEQAGLLAKVKSSILEKYVPANLRHPEGKWFGFSQRARIIFYDKERVKEPPKTYEELADPKYKGLICTRSSTNIYMMSLLASIIEAAGKEKAAAWVAGLWANRARNPKGGDTDQLRGIISGECAIVVSNHYYFSRGIRKPVKGLSKEIGRIGWVFPNQKGRGSHVNISAAGVAAHAPNPLHAKMFLEYLASESAQKYFSAGNDEFPVRQDVALGASTKKLGKFTADKLPLTKLGENQGEARIMYDAAGYK